jgi:hypothetical protein
LPGISNAQQQQSTSTFCLLNVVKTETFWVFCSAVFTLSLAWFSYLQIEISRDTAKKQLRAYISITPNREAKKIVLQTVGKNDHFEFLLDANNWGQTPAKNIKFWGGIDLIADILDKGFWDKIQKKDIGGITILNPGQNNWFYVRSLILFEDEKLYEFGMGRLKLLLYGKLQYEDIFDEQHNIDFCFQYNPFGWSAVEGHNKIT